MGAGYAIKRPKPLDVKVPKPKFVGALCESMARMALETITLAFQESGSGPPLVFLSGLGGDHRAFLAASQHFARRFRVILPDHRDSGNSPRAQHDYTTIDMAHDLAALLDRLDAGPAVLIGHSLGGMVAQQFAVHYPDRVRGLVLASTYPGGDPWRSALVESWITLRTRATAPEFTRATLPWLVSRRFYQSSPDQVEGLIRFVERGDLPQPPEAFVRQARAAMTHDCRHTLPGCLIPSLVLVGDDDIVNPPACARELAAILPNSTLKTLPGVGHLPHVEAGKAFREAISEFLHTLPGDQNS